MRRPPQISSPANDAEPLRPALAALPRDSQLQPIPRAFRARAPNAQQPPALATTFPPAQDFQQSPAKFAARLLLFAAHHDAPQAKPSARYFQAGLHSCPAVSSGVAGNQSLAAANRRAGFPPACSKAQRR